MRFSTAAIVAAVTLGLFVIIGWLSINKVDTANYFLMIPAILPAVAALFGVSSVKASTDTIRTNTNGTLSALNAAKAVTDTALMHALAILTPDQASVVLASMSGNPITTATTTTVINPTAPAAAPTPAPMTPAPVPTVQPLPAPAPTPTAPPAPAPLGTFVQPPTA
jgi:hypothetical protein